jgi:hypothetical protein
MFFMPSDRFPVSDAGSESSAAGGWSGYGSPKASSIIFNGITFFLLDLVERFRSGFGVTR